MKNKNLLSLTLICAIALISSCTIQKRTFRPGYHIEWKKNYSSAKQSKVSTEENLMVNNEEAQLTHVAAPVQTELTTADIVVDESNPDIELSSTVNQEVTSSNEMTISSEKRVISEVDYESENPIVSKKELRKKSKKTSKHAANGGKLQIVALILCILLGLIGVHRFYLGYTGLGVLYLFTLGLFGIGWIIDIILLIIPNGLTPKGRNNYKE